MSAYNEHDVIVCSVVVSGLLISGDDRGNIWLYNVEDFVKSPHVCDEPLKPSRVSDGW